MGITFGLGKSAGAEEEQLFPEQAGMVGGISEEVGRLSVDVIETDDELTVRSAIAGVRPEELEVSVHNEVLTVRGRRHSDHEEGSGRYLVRECHWGAFSRSLILPSEVDADRIAATIKDGILTVRMPKIRRDKRVTVRDLS